jgi:hypothetical protein
VFEPPSTITAMPSTLDLPADLVIEVMRSGKTRVVYTTRACVTADGIVVEKATRQTGFPALDVVLHRTISDLSSGALGACVAVTLHVSHFECEIDATLM